MSQALLEQSFPFEAHQESTKLRDCVRRALVAENANTSVDNYWDDGAEVFIRASYADLRQALEDRKIFLTEEEFDELYEFCQEYASLKDQEADAAEDEELIIELRGEHDD